MNEYLMQRGRLRPPTSGRISCQEPSLSNYPKPIPMRTRIVAPDLYACEVRTFEDLLLLFSKESPGVRAAVAHLREQDEPVAFYSSIVEARLERLGLVERTQDAKFTLSHLGKILSERYQRWEFSGFSESAYGTLTHDIVLVIPNPDSQLRSVAGIE